MHHDTWERLGDLFLRALELPEAERGAWLDRECGEDDTLRGELDAMLRAHGAGTHTAPEHLLPSMSPRPSLGAGDRVGHWQLDGVIGRGGMGEVFLATRADDQFTQRAAVKVVRPERASPELVRRFFQERQILAQLVHPHIATLLDGGIAPTGQPYLVMQYVEGVPITRYATDRGLSLEDRLRLFVTVCDAVQFAHQHLVVHRDLKPSNILVGADGQPRLLDFGIAKLLDPAASSSTTGDLLLLTPEHAAPEQFLGQPVTTATDVYALGVLLYELLTGARPFRDRPAHDLPRAVREETPAAPGSIRPVDGDLDQITLMALRKEPGRRYPSAGALGADVARFLGRWPVVARPDTAGYRVRRFVRRHRLGVAAAALMAVTLVGATGFSAWQSGRRALALREAEAERHRATRVTNFLLSIFRATNPNETRGRTVTARELLDQAAARVKVELAREPGARADMELAIGRAYGLLGLTFTSDTILAGVVAAQRAMQPVDSIALANAIEGHARTVLTLGRLQEGSAMLREVIAIREAALGPDAIELAPAYQRLGIAAQQIDPTDRDGTSIRSFDRALDLYLAADSVDQRAVSDIYRFKAVRSEYQDSLDQSLAWMRQSVAAMEAATAPDDPARFNAYETLGIYLTGAGQVDSAIPIHRRNLADRRRVFGAQHPDVTFSLYNLARDLGTTGQYEESFALFRECIALREKAFGPVHIQVGFAVAGLARSIERSGDTLAALPLFERAAAVMEQAVGPTSYNAMTYSATVARVQLAAGRRDAAIRTLGVLVDRGYRELGRDEWTPLRADPRFRALEARAAADSAAARGPDA